MLTGAVCELGCRRRVDSRSALFGLLLITNYRNLARLTPLPGLEAQCVGILKRYEIKASPKCPYTPSLSPKTPTFKPQTPNVVADPHPEGVYLSQGCEQLCTLPRPSKIL